MVRTMIVLAAMALAFAMPAAHAQEADSAALSAQAEAMHKLDWMHGKWRGEAVMQTPAGERRVTHTERVGTLLGGTITVIEGKSFDAAGNVPFNAFAVVAYDARAKTFSMASHAGGRSGTFPFTVTDAGYGWEVPAGPATIRYTATFAGGTWTEVGDYVAPGQPPRRFFTMTLRRIGDTDWPEGGSVTKD